MTLIRAPRPEDQAYIAATWARSMISGARSGHAMRRHGAQRGGSPIATMGGRIDAVLDRHDTRALVAVWPEHGPGGRDYIVGWCIYVSAAGVPIVHYVYTRDHDTAGRPLRGHGIAGAIFARLGITRTTPVVCTSDGPSSEALRGRFRASSHMNLEDFLRPKERR